MSPFCFVVLFCLAFSSAHPYNTMVRVGRSYNPQSAGMILSPFNRYLVNEYDRGFPQKRSSPPMDAEWEIVPMREEFIPDYYDF